MKAFVHLHVHTEYSLLDGLSNCRELAQQAADMGMPALAITDHGVMYGVVDFYSACQSAGIKPIIGVEAYVARESRHRRDKSESKPYHIVLLAQNQTGYQNLIEMASIAQLEGFYYKPRVDREILTQHSEGVIVLTACGGGEIPQLLLNGQDEQAREAVRWYQRHFPDRFYIELQTHEIPEFDPVYRQLVDLAHEMDVPLVATNDVHYAQRDQAEAHDVLLCIGTSKTVNEPDRLRMSDPSYYMRSPEEMWQLYGHIPEALENTVKIAEQCEVELQFAPPYHLPTFPVPEGCGSSEEYLRHLCYEGLVWRYGEERARAPAVVERLEHEMGVIHNMGFDDYFLIVWDLCEASKERDIWWNVRGSGAGSVVAYTLGITNVDPFKNRLMFERFLNPSRVNMPDIDLDYPDDRRDELIQYTVERYGTDHVTQIITFGTLGARAAVRDVGRALDVPLAEVDRVARLIPNQPGKPVSIAQALEMEPELKQIYETTPYIRKLLDTAEQVEGVARHASTHAAGVIISDKPLTHYLPLARPTKASSEDMTLNSVSQWPMEIVDEMGMLKVDFLGLRTLTHMRKACQLIEARHGRKLTLETIPYERAPDDPARDADVRALYDLLTSGDTTGVFQVEGAGMRRTLRELRPSQFQHIVAVLALYRPGPLENIPTYIRRMHGEEEVRYHHPILEDILDDTYAIIVYQEQIMQIAVQMAGYEPGEADMIRKAVAKKKKKLMAKHKKIFRQGAIKKGIAKEIADAVWSDIEFFARYGFNRAHATDYAVITAQTAYLKAHYPIEFMTALMTTERHNTEKIGFLISECRRMGIDVRPPDINKSDIDFTIEEPGRNSENGVDAEQPAIRFGLGAVKNVGEGPIRVILNAREAGGPFADLDDFCQRVDMRQVNRRVLESLIKVGALRAFGSRSQLLSIAPNIISLSANHHQAQDVGQMSLFGETTGVHLDARNTLLPALADIPEVPQKESLEWEKELVGVYISDHPLNETLLQLRESISPYGCSLAETDEQQVTIAAMVRRVRRHVTKKGKEMAFITLEDVQGTCDVVVFPSVWEKTRPLWQVDRILVVHGKIDAGRRDTPSLICNWVKTPEDMILPSAPAAAPDPPSRYTPPPAAAAPKPTYRAPSSSPPTRPHTIRVTLTRSGEHSQDTQLLRSVHRLLAERAGRDHFIIQLTGGTSRPVELAFPNDTTHYSPELTQALAQIVGPQAVVIE
ncbi:MAG TPA: DNA polymerase III subunit alpha [Chloroflexi bacterium]|mgnify:CR=1 FL=1|nr:DNA polymerase III subunit alpha [Chloroflexota bacterium]